MSDSSQYSSLLQQLDQFLGDSSIYVDEQSRMIPISEHEIVLLDYDYLNEEIILSARVNELPKCQQAQTSTLLSALEANGQYSKTSGFSFLVHEQDLFLTKRLPIILVQVEKLAGEVEQLRIVMKKWLADQTGLDEETQTDLKSSLPVGVSAV